MAFEVSFTLLDAYGRTTNRRYGNNRTLIADVISDAAAMVTALEALTLSAVQKTTISQVVVVTSPSPETGANNDSGATLHCLMDNSKMSAIKIPAIDVQFINSDGTLKLTETEVTDFVALFETGGHWRISEGNYVVALKYGELDK